MKEIKTANYNKKFGRGEAYEAEGTIDLIEGRQVLVTVSFLYSPTVSGRDYLDPGSSSEEQILSVEDERGIELAPAEIELYRDQIEAIITDWEENVDLTNGPDSDWATDSRREDQMFDENGW